MPSRKAIVSSFLGRREYIITGALTRKSISLQFSESANTEAIYAAQASCKNCTDPRKQSRPINAQQPARASSSSPAPATRAPAAGRHPPSAASEQHHQHRLVEPPHRACREARAHASAQERKRLAVAGLLGFFFASHARPGRKRRPRRPCACRGAAGRPVQKTRRRDDEGGEQQRLAAGELHCSITRS